MQSQRRILKIGWLALLAGATARLPAAPTVKPEPLRLELGEVYLRTEVEYENERQSADAPASVFSRERTLVSPAVGFTVNGSFYHPNLLQFQLSPELGADWENSRVDPLGSASSWKFLQRYHALADLLAQKPYATSIIGDKDMVYRDYDFFSRVRVDSQQFAARSGYAGGPVPFTLAVQHYDETEDNPQRPRDFRQNTFSLSAENHRTAASGRTQLTYNLSEFTRHDDGFNTTHGLNQNLTCRDSEEFGARKQARLTSTVNYTSLTRTEVPTSRLLAQEDLRLEHTPKLQSAYDYLFSYSTAGDSDARTHDGRVDVTWELLRDLSVGWDARADDTRATSPGSTLDSQTYGAGLSAQYSPTLSSWARLVVGDSVHYDHDRREASGVLQNIIGEALTLTDGIVTLLNQPNVAPGTIHVWGDAAHSIAYFAGVDYEVIAHGDFTEIRRVPGGTIPNGATVYVDYAATQQGSSAYDTVANSANFRLDFWNGCLGLFGHWTRQFYDGGENLLLRTINDKLIGVDATCRWFRASAEYEDADANLAPYRRARFTQSAHAQPGNGTDLSMNSDEGWTDFPDMHLRQTSYGFTTRLQQQFARRLAGGVEGGVRIERGETFDRDYATARLWLDWAVGKLTVKLSYDYNTESHVGDRQDRHYVFLRARRDL